MTHAIGVPVLAEDVVHARVNIPILPTWVVPRPVVADRLDLGISGLLTVVSGATGWGKTLGVASWAKGAGVPGGRIWLSLTGGGDDPDIFWKLLRGGLMEAGERHLAPIPEVGAHERRRLHALTTLGSALKRSGPWVVVLDDYPSGQGGQLGVELQLVLEAAQRGLRLVVISRGDPAIEMQRHHVAGELTRITDTDLAMGPREVAEVLARHGDEVSEITARVVEHHTGGWPCGVRLAAVALQGAPTIESALEETDRATVDFLASEVLAKMPPRMRELIIRTSFLDDVTPALASAVLGSGAETAVDGTVAGDFVQHRPDGSFRCHPLFRAAARRQLDRDPGSALEARRRAAQSYVDHGDAITGVGLAMAAEDWSWVGRALVESYAVPRILGGSAGELVESALRVEAVLAAEPLLRASVALGHGQAAAGNSALKELAEPAAPTRMADRVSAAFIRLAMAELEPESATGVNASAQARGLVALLPEKLHSELAPLLDVYVGGLEVARGRLHDAAITLGHGATCSTSAGAPSAASLECRGQLALVEAFRGNLCVAEGHATSVLDQAGDEPGRGRAFAHLATAWLHLERAEPGPGRQHLDRAIELNGENTGAWWATALELAEARLLAVTGQPEAAPRRLLPVLRSARDQGRSGWTTDLLAVASAEALLSAGEARRALDLITPHPATTPVEAGVLKASALLDLEEVGAARKALEEVATDVTDAPLGTQIERWLIEARIAQESGRPDRTHVLVDRALRTAQAEMLRRPFAHRSAWLAKLVDRDPTLRRAHGAFLASLRPAAFLRPGRRPDPQATTEGMVETLTEREAQVLGLLAEMCSTEEIAQELFLSVNTVKTYVRGILRKLAVNRRVDAVRRGRELGLC